MIIKEKEPGFISLTGNIIQFSLLETDMVFKAASAKLTFSLSGGLAEGDAFTLTMKKGVDEVVNETFTFKNNPANDNELPVSGVQNIADALRENILTSPYFIVTETTSIAGSYIVFESKDKHQSVTVEIDDAGMNGHATAQSSPAEGGSLENYQFLFDLLIEKDLNSNEWELAASLTDQPDANGKMHFQLQELLHKVITAKKTTPKNYWDTPVTDEGNLYRFAAKYFTKSGTPPAVTSKETWSPHFAYLGGISAAAWPEQQTLFNKDNSILSNFPLRKRIHYLQKELLPFVQFAYRPSVKCTWYDDNNAPNTLNVGPGTGEPDYLYKTWIFRVGPDDLGLPQNATHYEIKIENDSGVAIAPVRTYIIDRHYYGPDSRQLLFYNSMSCPEVVTVHGSITKELKINRDKAARILAADYSELYSQDFQVDADWQNYFTYSTGFITREEADALQELLILNEVFEIFSQGYIPIQILTDTFKVSETRQGLHSYTFKAVPRLRPKHYTAVHRITPPPETQGWAISAGDFWKTVFGLRWQIAQ